MCVECYRSLQGVSVSHFSGLVSCPKALDWIIYSFTGASQVKP